MFTASFALNALLLHLAETVETCGFRLLTATIANMRSVEEYGSLITRIALSLGEIKSNWNTMLANIGDGSY
jgi:hypothetical protein